MTFILKKKKMLFKIIISLKMVMHLGFYDTCISLAMECIICVYYLLWMWNIFNQSIIKLKYRYLFQYQYWISIFLYLGFNFQTHFRCGSTIPINQLWYAIIHWSIILMKSIIQRNKKKYLLYLLYCRNLFIIIERIVLSTYYSY